MRGLLAASVLLASAGAWAATLQRPLLGVGAESRYDDDALADGGDELMTKLSPELGWRVEGRRTRLDASYTVDLIHHLRAGNLTVDHRARLAWREALDRRLTLSADASFYRVEDTATLPRFGVARVTSGALWAVGELAGRYRLTRTDTVELGYRGEATRLYARELPLGAVHALSGGWRGQLSERFEIGARYRLQLFTSDAATIATAQLAALSLRFMPARHASLYAELGPVLFRAAGTPSTAVYYRAGAGYEARGLLLGIEAARDYVGAAGFATAIWADSLHGAIAWRVYRPVNLYAGGGLFRNGLAPAAPSAAEGYAVSTGVEWRLAEALTGTLAYDRIGQFATAGQGLELARNILSARLVYRTP